MRGQALVGNGALLEEQHPRRHRSSDIGEQDENCFLRESTGKRFPGEQRAADGSPVGMAQQGDRDEYQVEHGGDEGNALPGPIAMGHQGDEEDDPCTEDGDGRGHAEESQASADGNELGDQSEEVADHEVDHGEPSPEGAEAVEDEFGVTAMRGGAETHGHLLHDAGHDKGEDYEGEEETDAAAGSG